MNLQVKAFDLFVFFVVLNLNLFGQKSISQARIYYDCIIEINQTIHSLDSVKIIYNGDVSEVPFTPNRNFTLRQKIMTCISSGDYLFSQLVQKKVENSGWRNSNNWKNDTFQFSNNNWYKVQNENYEKIEFEIVKYEYLDDHVLLFGFKCHKVHIKDKSGKVIYQALISSELPNTLMPVFGFIPMSGAIIELKNLVSGISYSARKIDIIEE